MNSESIPAAIFVPVLPGQEGTVTTTNSDEVRVDHLKTRRRSFGVLNKEDDVGPSLTSLRRWKSVGSAKSNQSQSSPRIPKRKESHVSLAQLAASMAVSKAGSPTRNAIFEPRNEEGIRRLSRW